MSGPLQIRGTAFLLAVSICIIAFTPALADPPRYSIEDIRPGGQVGQGTGINNSGQVTGTYLDGENRRSFFYSDGESHDIGTLGGESTHAQDINKSGQITGYSTTVAGNNNAFLYSDGVMQDLGNLGGAFPQSFGFALNDAGEVTGESLGPDGGREVFLYSGGTMQRLDLIPEACRGLNSSGRDINNSGHITGEVATVVAGGCLEKAFIYRDGEVLLIGDLLPGHSTGHAINDSGQVAMHVLMTGDSGAFLYTDGRIERIGGQGLIPNDINNLGWVVGVTELGGSNSRAFLYVDGEVFDLTALVSDLDGWQYLLTAQAINDSGQITGQGVRADGGHRAFLLTPLTTETEVRIDIKPTSDNRINLRSQGNIDVAVLSTPAFDAAQVDWQTVTFGPRDATEIHERSHLRDVDGDGDMDFVAHFKIRETGIRCGDKEATLDGETFDGLSFTGTDAITVVKCP